MTNENNLEDFNRRKFIRAMGGTAGASVVGASGIQGVAAQEEPDMQELPDREASQHLRYAMSVQEAGALRQQLIDDGYRPNPSEVAAVRAETEKQEVNAANPVLVFLPFEKRNGEGMGIVSVLVVDDQDGNRIGSAGWASTVESKDENPTTDADYSVKQYVWDDETDAVTIAEENVVEMSDSVSTQDLDFPDVPDVITAAACLVVVGEACRIYGTGVTRTQCVSLCFRTANPAVVLGCSGLCFAITAVLNRYGCGTTGGFLCGALGFNV